MAKEDNLTNPIHPSEPLTSDQLYLRDKESFFRNNPIKITPYSEILKTVRKLTSDPVSDPTLFDQAMKEIHDKQKLDAQQPPRSQPEEESSSGSEEEETEWTLDLVQNWSLSAKKVRLLFELPNLSGVLVRELGQLSPSRPPTGCLILSASALRSGLPIPFPRLLSRFFRRIGGSLGQLHPNAIRILVNSIVLFRLYCEKDLNPRWFSQLYQLKESHG